MSYIMNIAKSKPNEKKERSLVFKTFTKEFIAGSVLLYSFTKISFYVQQNLFEYSRPPSTVQLEHKAVQLTPEVLEQKQVLGVDLSTWNEGFWSFGSLSSAQNPHPSNVVPAGHLAKTLPTPFFEMRLYSDGESIHTAAQTPPFLM